MAKLSLTDLANLQNEQTAVAALNANSAATETALENTLSRDGTSPNAMGSTLDMNSNRIINLPAAIDNSEPVRLAEFNALAMPAVVPVSIPVAVGSGGTGATTAATARANLGLTIGTNVQAFDADLSTLAALPSVANLSTVANLASVANLSTLANQANVTNLTTLNGYTAAKITNVNNIKEALTAGRTYFVRTDGADTNTGLVNNAGGAFLTVQKAVDTCMTLDFAGQTVVIQVADGTYTSPINFPYRHTGGGTFILQGNIVTPANCLLGYGAVNGVTLTFDGGSAVTMGGFQVQANTTSGVSITVANNSKVLANSLTWGAANIHLVLSSGWMVYTGNTTIVGGGAIQHHITNGSFMKWANGVGTVTGTPSFATFFAGFSENSTAVYESFTYSGGATGKHAFVHQGAVIETSDNTFSIDSFFPGSIDSAFNGGAQYNDVPAQAAMIPVASLPTPKASLGGLRFVVTDANSTTFLAAVAGGGANIVPVFCNGSAWKIG